MATPRQVAANRANAQKSTGPKSNNGKATSSRNAMSHGLAASRLLLDDEDPEIFEEFCSSLTEELAPIGSYEAYLVDRIVMLIWRSRRVPVFEAAILRWMKHWCEERYDVVDPRRIPGEPGGRFHQFHKGLRAEDEHCRPDEQDQLILGRLLHQELNHGFLSKLSYYDARIFRELKQSREELLSLQAKRVASVDIVAGELHDEEIEDGMGEGKVIQLSPLDANQEASRE